MSGILVLICRLSLGGVWVYASLDKLGHPQAFAEVIHHYRLVPYALLHPAALWLPMLEFVLGLTLILGIGRRGAALLSSFLLLVFMVAITTALARGLDISCGCFNTDGGHAVGISLLGRDLVFLLLGIPVLFGRESGPALSRLWQK